MTEATTVGSRNRDKTRMLAFRISPTEQRRLRVRAAIQGVTIEKLLRQRLEDYLSEPVLEGCGDMRLEGGK